MTLHASSFSGTTFPKRSPVFLLALFWLCCLLSLPCPGPAAAATAYYKVEAQDPAQASWDQGLVLSLPTDGEACREAYGNDWYEECGRALGEQGARVQGLEMRPQVPGEWRWEGYNTLHFRPATPSGALQPNTTYDVDLSSLRLPGSVRLSPQRLSYKTQPQAVRIGAESVWIASSAEKHGLSVPLYFVWPVDNVEAVEKAITIQPEKEASKAGSGLRLGKPAFAWTAARDMVVISVPVLRLGEEPSRVQVRVQGLPSFTMDDEKRVIQLGKQGKQASPVAATHAFGVPGRSTLFAFKDIKLVRGHDRNLNVRYELELHGTLRMDPAKVLQNMRVHALPEKIQPGQTEPTDWTLLPSLPMEDIRNGTRLEPMLLSADAPSDVLRFALPLQSDRCIAVYVDKSLTSESGIGLAKSSLTIHKAPELSAELSFLFPGNLVSTAGSRKIALHCVGLDSVHWKARRIRTPFLALFAASHGFSLSTLEPWMDEVDLESLGASTEGTLPVSPLPEGQAAFPVLELDKIVAESRERYGLFQVELTGLKNGKEVVKADRLLLLTNLGLTIKENADGSRNVYVVSLFSGTPVANVSLQVLAKNGTVVAKGTTNASGMAVLPSTAGLAGENEPVALVAQSTGRDPDLSWISLKDKSRVLDNGDFATAGRHASDRGLLASVFSGRGIYMPGDTLHFGILVRRFDWQPLPDQLPLEAVLTDPWGRTVLKKPLQGDVSLAEVAWTSSAHSPSGPYRLEVRIGGEKGPVLGFASVRVEEFEPDTLALQADLDPAPARGWIRTEEGKSPGSLHVRLSTLYGEAAAGHDIRASLVATPARLSFAGYEGYTFHDASMPLAETRSAALPAQVTNAAGEAILALPANAALGTFRGSLRIEGFEAAGGRAVTRQINALFSPLDLVLGYKPVGQATPLSCLQQGSTASIDVVALDNTLAPVALDNVQCTITNLRYVNALVRDASGAFRYESTPIGSTVLEKAIKIASKGTLLRLLTTQPGDFLFTLTRADGTVLLSLPYTVAGRNVVLADGTSSVPLHEADLHLELNKTQYEPGETIVVRMNTPYAGTGLVTVERENVVSSAWFRTEAGTSEQRVRIPSTFEGQGYVSVLFARTSNSEAIYVKPQVHATVPFSCGRKQRDMGLELEVPEQVLPGADMTVRVRSKRAGRALVFAVDEGVLSLTGYTNPDPLDDLLNNRALDVVTRQAFDLLMPDFARLQKRLPAFGGDMAGPGGRFLNPFRRRSEPPFARWIGMVQTNSDGTSIRIPVPAYLSGKIRVLAVGSSRADNLVTAGSAAASCTVRGSLLLRPMLPLAACPGDSFTAAITVANTLAGSGQAVPVRLKITADEGLALIRDGASLQVLEQKILVDENKELTLPLAVRVKDEDTDPGAARLGSQGLHFEATALLDVEDRDDAASLTSVRKQDLSVRPLSVAYTSSAAGSLQGVSSINVDRSLYPMGARTTLTVSRAPVAAFRALAARLEDYPFGCTEQKISRAFPWLCALGNPHLSSRLFASPNKKPAEASEYRESLVQEALDAIRASLTTNGVGLWPGSAANDFVTVYAADFLMGLAASGHGIPMDLHTRLLEALQALAWRDPSDLADARIRAYACWVLLRSGRIITQDVERLHTWLAAQSDGWKNDLTAALLADCYAMLRLEQQAKALMPDRVQAIPAGSAGLLNTACARSLHACILSGTFWQHHADRTERQKELSATLQEAMDLAFDQNASTTAMALGVRALATRMDDPGQRPLLLLSCTAYDQGFAENAKDFAIEGLSQLEAPGCRSFAVRGPDAALTGTGSGDGTGSLDGLFWHVQTHGYDRGGITSSASGLEVRRRLLNSQGQVVTSAREGDVLTVELAVRSDRPLDNVALVDLLPGGLEPLLDQPPLPGHVEHSQRQEDRMLFFLTTDRDMRLVTYRVRAMAQGTYVVPALHAEAMYQPQIQATLGGLTGPTDADGKGKKKAAHSETFTITPRTTAAAAQ